MVRAWAIGLALLLGCDDHIARPDDTSGGFDACRVISCEPDVRDVPALPDPGPDVPEVSKDQCTLQWTFEGLLGGVPSHPIVDSAGVATVSSGDTIRRVAANGTESNLCAQPFRVPGEVFGTPSQTQAGVTFVGTISGRLYAMNRLCQPAWNQPVDIGAEACELTGKPILCEAPGPIRQAPALTGENMVYVLDSRPALHGVSVLANQGDYRWPHLPAEQEPLPGAAPVVVGGDHPFVAFPTRRTVVAVTPNGALHWAFDQFTKAEDGLDRHVTSPLAVTKNGQVLFGAGVRTGDQYTDLEIYRLKVTSPTKQAVVDEGFPKQVDLPLDTIRGLVIGPNESIYVAMASNGVMKLDPEGNILWKFIGDEESLRVSSVPAIGDDSSVFLTAEPHFVYGVDRDGNRIFRHQASGELTSTSPAIRDDGLVLVHFGTELRAWSCPGVTGLAVSSWPRYQRSNRNGGNLQEPN